MPAISGAPTIDTEVNFWPGMIDMLTSLLMFFLLIHFVQNNANPASLAAAVAGQKQQQFTAVFDREFANEIRQGDVVKTSDVNLLRITFGEGILFEPGEYRLKGRGEMLLRRLAGVVHESNAMSRRTLYDQIQIEGHTDDASLQQTQFPRDNWDLSYARARRVLQFMTERGPSRLDAKMMSATGFADTRPVDRRRSRNRRIEIRIYFSGNEVAPANGGRRG